MFCRSIPLPQLVDLKMGVGVETGASHRLLHTFLGHWEMAATKSGIPGTGLRVPDVPPDLVRRPRLTAELQRTLSSKLTLLSAPAGFGKTVLVSEWLRARDQPGLSTAWVSLEESDNDFARFLRHLVAALGESREGIGEASISSLGFPELESADSAMAALANEMEKLPDELLVVLDDYHLIEEPAVHSSAAYLLDHLPTNVHLLIATRSDPQLPVARLRARGELVEVRAVDLAFNLDEAEAFLSQRIGSEASTEEISALHSRTEGWPAGLRLAAASLKDHQDVATFLSEFTGSHRFVFDYLAEEVMNRESEQVQAFLLQTSILGRLSGPLCDAVTESSDGQGPAGAAGAGESVSHPSGRRTALVPLPPSIPGFPGHAARQKRAAIGIRPSPSSCALVRKAKSRVGSG